MAKRKASIKLVSLCLFLGGVAALFVFLLMQPSIQFWLFRPRRSRSRIQNVAEAQSLTRYMSEYEFSDRVELIYAQRNEEPQLFGYVESLSACTVYRLSEQAFTDLLEHPFHTGDDRVVFIPHGGGCFAYRNSPFRQEALAEFELLGYLGLPDRGAAVYVDQIDKLAMFEMNYQESAW